MVLRTLFLVLHTLLMVLHTLLIVLRTLLMVLRTLFLVLRTLLMVLRTLLMVLRTLFLVLRTLFLMLRTVWLDVDFVLFIHPVLRTPLKRGIWDGGEVFLEAGGFLLDVVFVFLPPLCLPQDGGEAFLDMCGFWLIGKIGGKVRGCVVVWVIVCGIETNHYFRIIILHFIKGFTKWQKIRIKKRQL